MILDPEIYDAALKLVKLCKDHSVMLATAESCTGGLIAGSITAIDGSSAILDCGFVTYSNEAKHNLIGVSQELLDDYGAVSSPVAIAMAQGALKHAPLANMTISVTGIAGPGGGSEEKPVGLVHFGSASTGQEPIHQAHIFSGDRHEVRKQTILKAFQLLTCRITNDL